MNVLKEIRVTESYLKLDKEFRKCQEKEKEDSEIQLPLCSGLIVSSYFKPEITQNFDTLSPLDIDAYRKYMKWSFPSGISGKNCEAQGKGSA